jgi:arylsulfatase A-like enzyme
MVRLLDVAPTILDLAGIPAPPSFHGLSLLGDLEGRPGPPRATVSEMETLKTRIEMPWKLILDMGKPTPILFNLESDPREQSDVAVQHPERVAALVAALRRTLPGQLREVPVLPQEEVPAELREQLRALGYVE